MNIPSLPTDNLYKFMALFGMVIVFALNYWYDKYESRLKLNFIENEYNIEKFKFEVAILETEIKNIGLARKGNQENLNKLKPLDTLIFKHIELGDFNRLSYDKDFRESTVFQVEYLDKLFPEIKIKNEIQEQYVILTQKTNELYLKSLELKRSTAISDMIFKEMTRNLWSFLIGTFVGISLIVIGFKNWYYKYQKYYDIEIVNSLNKLNKRR